MRYRLCVNIQKEETVSENNVVGKISGHPKYNCKVTFTYTLLIGAM